MILVNELDEERKMTKSVELPLAYFFDSSYVQNWSFYLFSVGSCPQFLKCLGPNALKKVVETAELYHSHNMK